MTRDAVPPAALLAAFDRSFGKAGRSTIVFGEAPGRV